MKKIAFLGILVICLTFSAESNAQILKKLGKKIENSVERKIDQKEREQEAKVDRKIDEGVNTVFDAPEDAVKEEINSNKKPKKAAKKKENKGFIGGDLGGGTDINKMLESMQGANNIAVADTYTFNNKVVYELKENSNNSTNQMTYWFGTDESIFGVEMGFDTNVFMIYDLKQDAMLMLSMKDKTMQVMPMSMFGAIYGNMDEEEADPLLEMKKVSGTKKIAGYSCEKYEMTSKDVKGEFWFSKDVDFDMSNFSEAFLNIAKKSNQSVPQISGPQNGFMMQMISTDLSTNAVTQMTVKEIAKTPYALSTSQFKKTGM